MSSQLLGLTGMEDGTSAGSLLRVCSRSMRRSTFAPIRRALSQPELGTDRIVRFVTKQAPAPQALKFGGVLEKARRGVYCTRLRAHRQPPGSPGRPTRGYFDGGPLACTSYAPQALEKNGLWPATASEHTHQGAASWWRAS